MTEANIRGSIREKPDPMALRTRGTRTTYEKKTVSGVATKVRQRGGRISVRRK